MPPKLTPRSNSLVIITPLAQPVQVARPAVFLGGAITGASDWQQEAAHLLDGVFATAFNPRRPESFLPPDDPAYLESYVAQVKWEHRYLLSCDVILFWMPPEAQAVTTRFEIGWFYGRLTAGDTANLPKMAVGIAPGVVGDTYYRIVLPAIGVPVHTSLEATCTWAAQLVKEK